MQRPLTIIMYHYVRELEHSRYPAINGLTVQEFNGQLDYVLKHYTVITIEECVAALNGDSSPLPDNAALLTFDDGYVDHFTNVFPILYQKGIQGCFFPASKAVQEHRVLDVNKIHFLLAAVEGKAELVQEIFTVMDELRPKYGFKSNEYYSRMYAQATARYDSPNVVLIKTLLQKELPEDARGQILERLFRMHVSGDEEAFARELYLSSDQLTCMRKAGMYIGSHSHEHRWLDGVSPSDQEAELERSLNFLGSLGYDLDFWGFCYPYGTFNDTLLSLLRTRGCKFGLISRVGIADLDHDDSLLLPRLDTNDLPKNGQAEPNEWTLKVMSS